MKSEILSEAPHCPLCGKIPENPENGNYGSYVWSDFCLCHICNQCNLELNMEFYKKESRHFTMAASLLGLDIWECKKRYLQDSIAKTKEQLNHETEKVILGFLNTSIIRCTLQIEAIDRFLEEREGATSPEAVALAEQKLDQILSGRESDTDEVG